MSIKMVSYNIHKGLSISNKDILLNIKNALVQNPVDFVFLQEVVGKHKKLSASQFELLADTVWTHYSYGKNSLRENYDHGNAFLSKYPIIDWTNKDLSSSFLEKRGLLYGKVEVKKKTIHCLCVHLSLLEKDRKIQIEKIKNFIDNLPPDEPLILAGDFNDWGKKVSKMLDSCGMKEAFFHLHGAYGKTFPSFAPSLSLDRVYYKNLSPKKAKVLKDKNWDNLSDHLALMVEFDF